MRVGHTVLGVGFPTPSFLVGYPVLPCAAKARKSALGSTALKEEHQEARQRGRLTEN